MILITKTYFIIAQVLILLIILFASLKKKHGKYFLFSSRLNFSILITGAIIIGYFFNKDYQLFCIPVNWTKISLLIFSIYFVGNWIFKKIIGDFVNQLVLGIGLFISTYIIIFGSYEYLIWSSVHLIFIVPIYFLAKYLNKKFDTHLFDFLNLFGVTMLLPYIVILWTIWQLFDKKVRFKISILISPLFLLFIGTMFIFRMNKITENINNSDNKTATTIEITKNKTDRYLTELILGAHWKYHTRLCLYDGRRPPFHDPVLGFAYPFLKTGIHLKSQEVVDLYKVIFPNNNTKFDCKCAKYERLILIN